jgi:hypothetical protein
METEDPLPLSQKSATWSYNEPDQSDQHPPNRRI